MSQRHSTSRKSGFDGPALLRNFPLRDVHGLLRFARRRLNEERLPQVAGSLTFTTVLALVPMLTIAFAIFTTFPLFNTFRASLEAYFIKSLMPKTISNTILGYLNQFASKASRLSAVGAVGLILTAVATMLTIDSAFNRIWRVRQGRPLAQRLVVYWSLVTLGPLLVGVSITVTSYFVTATSGFVAMPLMGSLVYTAFSIVLTMLAFTMLYLAVPNRVVDWRDAACGGLLAAVAFEFAKRIFVVFITKFPTYTMIYGAVAALPIFLLWVYISWLITLIGAVLVAALPVVKYERWWHEPTPGSEFVDAMAILRVLYEARASGRSAAVDARAIRSLTRIGFDESETLLDRMLDAGWVGRIRNPVPPRRQLGKRIAQGSDAWTLLGNPEQIRVADVYRMFVFSSDLDAKAVRQVEDTVERGLGQTLAEHFQEAEVVRTMPSRSASANTSPSRP